MKQLPLYLLLYLRYFSCQSDFRVFLFLVLTNLSTHIKRKRKSSLDMRTKSERQPTRCAADVIVWVFACWVLLHVFIGQLVTSLGGGRGANNNHFHTKGSIVKIFVKCIYYITILKIFWPQPLRPLLVPSLSPWVIIFNLHIQNSNQILYIILQIK